MTYNEERKTQFIEAYDGWSSNGSGDGHGYLMRLFNCTADLEYKLDKDICDWNVSEILTYLKSRLSRSYLTLFNIIYFLRMYREWCDGHGYVSSNQNYYDEITKEMISSCVNTTLINNAFLTRRKLLEVLNGEDIVNAREKFIMFAIFEGLGGGMLDDIVYAKLSDIHGDKIELYDGRTLTISEELIALANEASNSLVEYPIFYQPDDEKDNAKIRMLKDVDYIVKPRINGRGETVTYSTIKVMLNTYCSKMESSAFSIHSLKISGIINYVTEIMTRENLRTPQEVFSSKELCDEIFYRYGRFKIDIHMIQYGDLYEIQDKRESY